MLKTQFTYLIAFNDETIRRLRVTHFFSAKQSDGLSTEKGQETLL